MKAKKSGWVKGLAFVTAALAVMCFWVLRQYSLPVLRRQILGIHLGWMAAAVLLMVVYWLLEAIGLNLAVRRFAPSQRLEESFKATMIGQFFNCITPFSSGGQPMQAWYLMKKGVSISGAGCSLLIKFIVYQMVLTVYSAVTLLWCFKSFAGRMSAVGWLSLVGFGVNLLVIAGLICLGFFKAPTEGFLYGTVSLLCRMKLISEKKADRARERIAAELAGFYEGFDGMRRDWANIMKICLLTALQLTAFFMVPLCIFYAMGLGKADVLLMICAGAFVLNFTSFVPLPGAAAGAELGFHTVFSLFFPTGLMGIVILLWRLLTFYLPILVGGCFTAAAGVCRENRQIVS